MTERRVRDRHGDLDKQRAANEEVDQAPDHGRGKRERGPPSQAARQPG